MGFSMRWMGAALAVALAVPAGAQVGDPDVNKEAAAADALYQAQNLVGALPLYEDLHKRQPDSNLWRERLAMSLLGGTQTEAESAARLERAHKLLLEAKAAGDNSNLLQVMLEKMEAPMATGPAGPPSPGAAALQQAEKAFSTGDLPGALQFYEQAAAADPKLYEAPLYAGDTEFKQGHYAEANKWYGRAAAINPDRETAYRYWGDSLMKQGDFAQAEGKFIDAVIAEPYTRTTRVGLKQWADSTKALLVPPQITLPARPVTDAKGNTNITVDPTLSAPGTSAALMYSMNATVWRDKDFKEHYPAEKQYRHSLAEEVAGLRGMIEVVKNQKLSTDNLDVTLKTLIALDADKMLECWVLLDHADQGLAQDYVAYRAAHRDLLRAYIAKYDVHPK